MCIRDSALYLDLHQNPELSAHETQTAAKLAGRLRGLGYDAVSYTHLDVYKRQPIQRLFELLDRAVVIHVVKMVEGGGDCS